MSENEQNRLYSDLAWLWPLWEPLEDYKAECADIIEGFRRHSRLEPESLLDIGCGGGKNMFHFKKHFTATGIDISEPMLANCRAINPECSLHIADMRNFDLGELFDCAYLNDSSAYMTTEQDLLDVFTCAHRHLKPGGVLAFLVENYQENFKPSNTVWTIEEPGLHVTILENSFDPDPSDTTIEITFVYIIRRESHQSIEIDRHTCGLFPLNTWKTLAGKTGFSLFRDTFHLEGRDYDAFFCVKSA